MGRLSVSQNSEPVVKEAKPAAFTGSTPGTPQRIGISPGPKVSTVNSASQPSSTTLKRSSSKSHGSANPQTFNKSDVVPVIVPRTNNPQTFNKSEVVSVIVPRTSSRAELASESRRENAGGRTVPYNGQSKLTDFRKYSNIRNDSDRGSGFMGNKTIPNDDLDQDFISPANGVDRPATAGDSNVDDARCVGSGKFGMSQLPEPSTSYNDENYNIRVHKPRHASSMDIPKGGRTRSLVANWERKEPSPSYECVTLNSSPDTRPTANISYMRGRPSSAEKETVSASDGDTIADLMEQHQQFLNLMQSRLAKLQVVRRLWERKDVRGLISAMEKMSDDAVSADIISVLMEKSDVVTLDICTSLLPLLTSLLGSKMDRHLGISVEMLLKLVKIFGPVIHSTITAGPMVGVDLQAEQRLERCNLCFVELEKMKHMLPFLIKRGGSIAKSTQELNLALQEVL
ncbi:katanin p80 WD40 repeat-containing subunit B1-like protein [Iris pallida]|nr:katanin p80 WD40 repeat-containing subunit B1-like protein [Iris pallida]